MAKCNYCGNTTRKLVYNHTYEPRACSICVSQYFGEGGNGIVPREYNKEVYYEVLRRLTPKARKNLLTKLNGFFDSSITRELQFNGIGNKLRILFKTEQRSKFGIILIEIDIVTGQVKDLIEADPERIQQILGALSSGMKIF